jgi:hypothetical protein
MDPHEEEESQEESQEEEEESEEEEELRTLTHPAMPLWVAQGGWAPPLFCPLSCRDPPMAFALLEQEAERLRGEWGGEKFNDRVRLFASALYVNDLGETPQEREAAVVAYAALRKWMVARGEQEGEENEEEEE